MSKYDQNLNSFNSKKYIDNVKKVTAMFSKADTFIQGIPAHDSKLLNVGNESQKILINKVSQKLYLNMDDVPKLNKVIIEGNDLNNNVPCEQKEDYLYSSYEWVYPVKKKIIPPNSINVCIKCINYYSSKYLAKLLEVTHINPRQIDTYVIRDTLNNIIIRRMENKRIPSPRPTGPRGSILPNEMDMGKSYSYPEKEKSQISFFFVKLFKNKITLLLLTLFRKLGMVHAPLIKIISIISDNNREFYQNIENKKKDLKCHRPSQNFSWQKNYIEDYLEKLAKEPKSRYVKKSRVKLNGHKNLGLLDYKYPHISHFNERRGPHINNNSNMCGNIQVFKIESVKFLQLLNLKSFFTLFSVGKEELHLLDWFKIQKLIAEGKLWGILNLYLTNNELYFFILSSLKKQAIKDYNLTKYDIFKPDMLSLYEDKINNITHQAIFNTLKNEWHDIKWIISFKFDTVFLNEHKDILILNLKENLDIPEDYLFLNLINNLFNMEMIGLVNNKSMSRYNIFEHDKLSEFLLNIFFCKLDNKVNELKYNYYDKYNKLLWLKFWNLKLKDQDTDSQKLARDVITKAKLNFKYIRYLDTFIIGLNGTKSEVNEIREILDSFLQSELKLNNLHSYIIDIQNDNLKFMNINISSGLFYGNKYKILFQFPKQLIIKALINSGILSNKRIPPSGTYEGGNAVVQGPKGPGGRWIPICKKNLLKYDLNIIINTYIDINNFVLSSFTICHDFFNLNRLLSYYINCSLKLTLQAKLGNKLWSKVIAPITPLKGNSKIYGINNPGKYVRQRSTRSLEKRLGQPNLNIFLLFRLGLITPKIFKKLYYFRVNNKKYLKRKYTNGKSNCSFYYYINHINWESNVNFDFLISNYSDSSIPFINKSREVSVAPESLKVLSFNNPRRLL